MLAKESDLTFLHGRQRYKYHGRDLKSGNRCGHDPAKPNEEIFNYPKKRGIQETVTDLLVGVRKYFYSPGLLPSLSNPTGRKNNDGTLKSNRSEAREAEMLVLKAIIHSIDWSSMRVGTPKADGSFVPRDGVYLAKVSGLAKRSVNSAGVEIWEPTGRFWRAFRRLRSAGAIEVFNVFVTKADGSKRARPAIKTVNQDFLVSMGAITYARLKKLRDWASGVVTKQQKKFKEKYSGFDDAKKARAKLGINESKSDSINSKPCFELKGEAALKEKYARERLEFQAELLASGAKFAAAMAKVAREFPTYESWSFERPK
jgi:hypothetical protein